MLISLTEFFGRFHPVLVHLPIGILLLGIALYGLSAKPRYALSPAVLRLVLISGISTALLSCITGYLLSGSGDYDDDLVSLHMWMAIALTAVSLLFLQRVLTKKDDLATKAVAALLLLLILFTGHLGGSLTHGSDYLTAALHSNADTVAKPKPIANVQEAQVYGDVIEPLLQTKCEGCHNSRKQKGGLRMDQPQLLLKGGKDGVVLLPGKANESELMKRLLLPREDEHHMPPKQKTQLNERELALIHWWIETGAGFTQRVKELPQPQAIKPVLAALQNNHPLPPAMVPPSPVEAGDEKNIHALKELGAVVLPVSRESNYLMVDFVSVPDLAAKDIALLQPLKKQLVWLKLNDTKTDDQAMAVVGQCSNLSVLYLNNTPVTDKGLLSLKPLNNLQVLSLVGTNVTATGLAGLTALKKLHSLFLYKTDVKAADTSALRKRFPSTFFDLGGYQLPFRQSDTARVTAPKPK